MLSVVSAYYNDRFYLPDCIKSVQAAKDLVTFPVEHIICDDASPIPSKPDPRARFIRREQNGGPAASRNTAIREAQYPYVMNLDSDDMIHPEYLRSCAPYMEQGIDVIYTDTHWFEAVERDFAQWDLDNPALFLNHPLSSCLIFKKELWARVGGYNERRDLIGHEDWAFTCALAKSGCSWKHINKHYYLYRRKKSGSLLSSVMNLKPERIKILKELYENR